MASYERYSNPLHLNDIDPDTIIQDLLSLAEKGTGEALYPGDERRIFLESAVAPALIQVMNLVDDQERQTLLKYARGEVLDAIGERLGVTRLQPGPAVASFQFTLSQTRSVNTIIPGGTKITTDGTVYFATDYTAIIPAGIRSIIVPATCTQTGSEYNDILVGHISTLVDLIPYVESAANITKTQGGDDGEPYDTEGDDRLRGRIRIAPTKLSTAGSVQAYKYWAMTADADIQDAAVISVVETTNKVIPVYGKTAHIGGNDLRFPTLTIWLPNGQQAVEGTDYTAEYEDNLITILLFGSLADAREIAVSYEQSKEGEVKILPLMKGGALPSKDILQKVRDVVTADDIRPMTDKVIVEAPKPVYYDIALTYWTQKAVESDVIDVIEGDDGAIRQYAAWQAEEIGRSINPDTLRRMCLAPDWDDGLIGALRTEVTSPVFRSLAEDEVAIWSGAVSVEHYTTAR